MRFIFITNKPDIAEFVAARGVDRVMVDLEVLGKQARQGHLNTLISRHSLDDVAAVRTALPCGHLMVRINPFHSGSADEIDAVVANGADSIMLPMFRGPNEVTNVAALVGRRARLVLLAETRGAMETMAACAAVDGVDEVHVGLNDLSLDLGLPFLFQPLARGLVDQMAAAVHASGKLLGIGGLARADEGLLPAQMLLGEHIRLGSTGAILSRTFHRNAASVPMIEAEMDFAVEVGKLRSAFHSHAKADRSVLEANRREISARIEAVAAGASVR